MAIELDNLRKVYGDVTAVDGISLTIGDGQFHCLLGPNGSGKSTLFRLMLGLTRPSGGTLSVPSQRVGCGFQRPNFYPDLTVAENIDVFARMLGGIEADWRETLVEELRLRRAMGRTASELSGGFARKLDLALAMLDRPEYLLLDEPLGALDDVSKARLLAFLDGYADEGNTVLVSTHHIDNFEQYVDRVTIVHRGRVVVDQTVSDLDLGDHESIQSYYVETVLAEDRETEQRGVSGSGR
ncbi:ABC transporter ATP-binding protein [Salinibaculum rarum]|uniref:ABC transporter ATP-binding protein n=1 Tax=Salinibaculum rarum TaxID=3058903 RepID=UPI00265F508C|nr:ABC transporter ATP-binding protein [Salinibaculum sp. KK48]